jgi:guanylate kinase
MTILFTERKKIVFVISGPSGSGKSTLTNMLLKEHGSALSSVISHTTRLQRKNEVNGVDYHFINSDIFKQMIQAGLFAEHVEYFGNYYGTSVESIAEAIKVRDACIMDLNWDGAFTILSNGFLYNWEKVGILILPPSIRSVKERLRARGSENEDDLKRREKESFNVKKVASYQYVIVNNDLNHAYLKLKKIFLSRS